MRTLIGFAVATLMSLGTATTAVAVAPNVAAPAWIPAGIEVIVVTAKRPPAQPLDAAQPINEFVVVAKRTAKTANPPPPAITIAIEMPKVQLPVARPALVRL